MTTLCALHPVSHQQLPAPSTFQPTVNLIDDIIASVNRPVSTNLVDDPRQDPLLQQVSLFDGVDVQASTNVPGDVAMERPDAGIVGRILQDDVAGISGGAVLEHLDVAALRVLRVIDFTVPGTDALGEDVKIVAVQMHRM